MNIDSLVGTTSFRGDLQFSQIERRVGQTVGKKLQNYRINPGDVASVNKEYINPYDLAKELGIPGSGGWFESFRQNIDAFCANLTHIILHNKEEYCVNTSSDVVKDAVNTALKTDGTIIV